MEGFLIGVGIATASALAALETLGGVRWVDGLVVGTGTGFGDGTETDALRLGAGIGIDVPADAGFG